MILKFLQGGGLQKLLASLQSQGAGDKAQSWVSTGENMQITPQELEQAVGSTEIEQIAQQAGASPEETKEVLAQALPQVVDKVTPMARFRTKRRSTTCSASCSVRNSAD